METERKVKDLVEKLKRGELTSKDIKEEMKKLGITHFTLRENAVAILLIGFAVISYLPIFANISNIDALKFLAQLPAMELPFVVKVILVGLGIGLLSVTLIMMAWASHLLSSKGGLGEGDETIIFIKDGPYKIVRHPISLGMMCLLGLPPLLLSVWVPYNILTAVCQIIVFASLLIEGRKEEETMDIKKWGDEYRRYQKEAPKFNFIKGLWNLRKTK
jgi:protein-S-isoprenylcysteine O-methyltransferase Ste14